MDADKKIELHIPSVMDYEKIAMETAASTAKRMGFTEDRIEDLKTAVAEACLNAVEHGNKMDTSTKVGIVLPMWCKGSQSRNLGLPCSPALAALSRLLGEEEERR